MRVEAFGCEYGGNLLSYSMPQGDKRGSDFELFDWTYDEDWGTNDNGVSFTLKNGLGSLVDGNHGPSDFKQSFYPKNRGWVG